MCLIKDHEIALAIHGLSLDPERPAFARDELESLASSPGANPDIERRIGLSSGERNPPNLKTLPATQ